MYRHTATNHAPGTASDITTPQEQLIAHGLPYSLLGMMQELSHARTLESIVALVREQARILAKADGISFVLKDVDHCHYIDEYAISPLWKGRKFPLSSCISGWAMLNRQAVAIEDIYQDPRVRVDLYRNTFVKSLAMTPVRRHHPIGAIGFYWEHQRIISARELATLQSIADSVSIAMENVVLYSELQSKVKALEESNHELSRFAWVASHDLQEPLRTITTQVELLDKRYSAKLDANAKKHIDTAITHAHRLQHLVEDLLVHARVEHSEHFKPFVMQELIRDILRSMQLAILQSDATITIGDLPWICGERMMLSRLFQNLISNGIKFHKPDAKPVIHISCARENGFWHFQVSDNGIGIESDQCERIFGLFQRVHSQATYPGSGIGLATCRKVVDLHRGRIWAESILGEGSTFHVLLPLIGDDIPTESVSI